MASLSFVFHQILDHLDEFHAPTACPSATQVLPPLGRQGTRCFGPSPLPALTWFGLFTMTPPFPVPWTSV